jgi:hypothetical protein
MPPCKSYISSTFWSQKLNNDSRIDVSIRLRRAVVLNDLSLVRRIIGNHPKTLRNPDFDDRSNTSLHLATKLGFVEIAVRSLDCPDWVGG